MSRIPSPADRPIPTSEPTVATQQTSETESVQTTDIAGKAPLEAEQVAKEPASTPETKGAQFESRLGGLVRQAEMQSQFPIPSSPTLKDLPELRPNLDPNVHLDEKIDLSKNLPNGQAINKGLNGLDWGPNKAKTGPGHFGVEMTYGGMKAPTDVLAEVRDGGKPGAPNASGPPKDARGTMTTPDKSVDGGGVKGFGGKNHGTNSAPPPGVELSSRAPKWGQVGHPGDNYKISPQSQAKMDAMAKAEQAARQKRADDKEAKARFEKRQYEEPKPNEYVDPDAGGGEVQLSAEEIARKIAVRGGATDPVRGSQGPVIEVDKPPVRYGDLVTDPGDTSEAIDGKSTSGNVLIGGGYTDGPRKDLPVGPPPGGSGGSSNEGDF